MKKILFWSAVTILAAVSCNKMEEGAPAGESNMPYFTASVDGADTKTVIDGMKSYWNGTEGIRVLDGKLTNGKVYTATVEKAETATFKEKDNKTLAETNYFAVYPEAPAGSVTWSGKVADAAKKFWLPANQTPTPGSYDPSTHIAVAYTTAGNKNLEFKNVTALVKFNLTSDNVKEVCFFGQANETLTGNFDVTYNSGNPTYTTEGSDYTKEPYAKIDAGTGKTLAKGTYYISVLPNKLSKGFCIETVAGSRTARKYSHTVLDLKRGQILDLGNLSAPAALTTEAGKVYLNPGNGWRIDDARFAAYFYDSSNNNKWVSMTRVNGQPDIYECTIPTGMTAVIFCRMNPSSTTNGWGTQVWGQTIDLSLAGGNLYSITTAYDSNNSNKATGTWSGTAAVKVLYLKPNSNWTQANARFAAAFLNSNKGKTEWVSMKNAAVGEGEYEVIIPSGEWKYVIFCRMNPSTTANNWDNKWDQTEDLTIPTNGQSLYTVKDGTWSKGGGSWSKK